MSKLLLTIVTGGFTLLGVILFASSQNIQENYLPAAIEQTQRETQTPMPTPGQNTKASIPLPTPVIIYITITPAPLETLMPALTPAPSFSPLLINTPAPTFTPVPSLIPATDHIFYTSSHWKAKFYYCDTDNDWKNLSENYLQKFSSEEELLQNYARIPHKSCN